MKKAQLIIRDRILYDDGAILEMVIWRVPSPVPPSEHDLKYSLFYGHPGEKLVGYDNERGKGDHKHLNGVEESYTFSTLERLLDDFQADVEALRGEKL